ncbi:hypothetical protein CS063_08770 [Sporanaerobium hydrogeniformans]|uniref:Uncharacterized protein n=1 Tax=Sporanaerobium hydrogeniformans TaxID=3072179 RepID=A0AC61DCB1_9FIRM|nr:hypothetical protein CS063_08770 [Sporanaerobium hydrogeniformans]
MLGKLLKTELKMTTQFLLPIYTGIFLTTFVLFNILKKNFTLNFKVFLLTFICLALLFHFFTWLILGIAFYRQLWLSFSAPLACKFTIAYFIITLFWSLISELFTIINFIFLIGGFNHTFFTSLTQNFSLHTNPFQDLFKLILTDFFLKQIVQIISSISLISFLSYIAFIFMFYLAIAMSRFINHLSPNWLISFGYFILLALLFVSMMSLTLALLLRYTLSIHTLITVLLLGIFLFNITLLLTLGFILYYLPVRCKIF